MFFCRPAPGNYVRGVQVKNAPKKTLLLVDLFGQRGAPLLAIALLLQFFVLLHNLLETKAIFLQQSLSIGLDGARMTSIATILISMTGAWIIAIALAVMTAVILLLLHHTPLGRLLHEHLPDKPRRRMFLASISFFLTFAGVRLLTFMIHNSVGPFHDIYMAGRHIHHLVWGILLLLLVGYGWLAEVGTGDAESSRLVGRLMSIMYGAAAALTLDEFALWLNLRDVYWAREGRSSVDAAILFGALLSVGYWGAPLIQAVFGKKRK